MSEDINSKISGNYIPSEEDIERLENWISSVEREVFPPIKKKEVKDWDKFREAQEKYLSTDSGIISVCNPITFYQSKYFTFYLKTDKGVCSPNLRYFKTEKEFQKFIKSGRYLIYRCVLGTKPITVDNSKRSFAVYYHYDFGKVSWFKNKLQFFINRYDLPKPLITWYYGIKNIPRPKLDIKLKFDS